MVWSIVHSGEKIRTPIIWDIGVKGHWKFRLGTLPNRACLSFYPTSLTANFLDHGCPGFLCDAHNRPKYLVH